MPSRNTTAAITIFTNFSSTMSGLYDDHIKVEDLHGAIFNFGLESRPEYLDDDNVDQVLATHILTDWDWWKEARAYQIYQALRIALLTGEKAGRVAWKQADSRSSWESLGALLVRQGLPALKRPEDNFNHSQNYGARQLAEAADDQGLPYRVFGYVQA